MSINTYDTVANNNSNLTHYFPDGTTFYYTYTQPCQPAVPPGFIITQPAQYHYHYDNSYWQLEALRVRIEELERAVKAQTELIAELKKETSDE